MRIGVPMAEGHGCAALAEQAHRRLARLTGGGHHARRADRSGADRRSVAGPLAGRLR